MAPPARKVFGARIKAARKDLGLTQEQAAEKARLSLVHYGDIERGSNSPSFEVFLRIAKVLKKNPSWFWEPFDTPLNKQQLKTRIQELAEILAQ